jgi:3-phosphoshikimate 1-carboxyvinyltransferase
MHHELTPPGDKAIAQRALLLAVAAEGTTRIRDLPAGADVCAARAFIATLGARVHDDGMWTCIEGLGARWPEQSSRLDCGSSATLLRLGMGLVAGRPGRYVLSSSAQLARRPMDASIALLTMCGAQITRTGDALTVTGQPLAGGSIASPIASAQLKSSVLLAGLTASHPTTITESIPTRDHLERLLAYCGRPVMRDGTALTLHPGPVCARDIPIPGDMSSAAPWIVATLLGGTAPLTLRNVGLNPTRLGLVYALQAMGADIAMQVREEWGHEPVGDLTILPRQSLSPIALAADHVATTVDELPLLAYAALHARGTSRLAGIEILQAKESDRLAFLLTLFGGATGRMRLVEGQGLEIIGNPRDPHPPIAAIPPTGDHRMAILGAVIAASQPQEITLTIPDTACVDKSYPRFWRDFAAICPRACILV